MDGPLRFSLLALVLLFLVAAPTASARDFNCDASAIRLQLGGSATVEPVTANRGATTCRAVGSPTSIATTNVSAGVLVAQTSVPNPREADAVGGLSQLTVGLGALAGIPNPTQTAINQIAPVVVPISPADQLLGLPAS